MKFLIDKKQLIVALMLCISAISLAQKKIIRLACIGNSVTYGSTHKVPHLTSYPALLQTLLGRGYEVRNFAVPGSTLLKRGHRPYYKTVVFGDMLSFVPDIAVIHLGLNDTDPGNWPLYGDEFSSDYSWLIDTIRKSNPAVKIFISRLSPIFHDHPGFKSGTKNSFWQIQGLIPDIAKANHTSLLDFHTALYSLPQLLPDNLHPNEEGAGILAKEVYQKLTGDFGGLQLPFFFTTNMVLQRNKPIPFFGTADSKENITVDFAGNKQTVQADEDGKWRIVFPAKQAGGPFQATISSSVKTILLNDILIGDVWLCSGQSNMAFPLKDAINDKSEMAKAQKNGSLRFLNRQVLAETNYVSWDSLTLSKVNKLDYFSGSWQKCDSANAKAFSAVAYYFGEKLQDHLNIPIGLIAVAVGGSTTESWIDRYTMEHHPVLVDELYNWKKSDFFMPWVRDRAVINLKNSTDPKQRHPYEPCYNYESGIRPFTDFPIQGVIWYQGESNAHNIDLHEIVFPELVKSWRKQWGYDFPFYYVQLSSLNRPSWHLFRKSQLDMLKIIPNSGMAISSDVGDFSDVHPRRKKEVGNRLARLALHLTHNQKRIVPYGPMPLKAKRLNNQIEVSFQYAGQQLKTGDGKLLRGFVLRNEKGIDKEAKAFIQKNKILIPVDKDHSPVSILYGWQPYTNANLVNSEGLPTSTFQLEIK